MTDSETESTSSDELIDQSDNIDFTASILNNYNIIYEIGRGSYSIVWLAYNIGNSNFYALKVQDPNEYKEGKEEIEFVKKLPKEPELFTNLFEAFSFIKGTKRYLCSAWTLT
jgi:serine/threonine protein kinase